jgi:hypothetical protein
LGHRGRFTYTAVGFTQSFRIARAKAETTGDLEAFSVTIEGEFAGILKEAIAIICYAKVAEIMAMDRLFGGC